MMAESGGWRSSGVCVCTVVVDGGSREEEKGDTVWRRGGKGFGGHLGKKVDKCLLQN